jgi:hypothetical protein
VTLNEPYDASPATPTDWATPSASTPSKPHNSPNHCLTQPLPHPTTIFDAEETAEGTRMTVTSRFATLEQMEQLVAMGMAEGMTLAMGQIDEILVAA